MEETEKYKNRIKGIVITITYTIIALFVLFIIGVGKAKAQVPDYNWNTPRLIGLSTSNNILDEGAFLVSGTNSNSITYNSNVWGGTNVYIRYRAVDSDQGTTYLAQGTYSFSYKVTFRLIGANSIAKVTPKLHYYPNNANTYGSATCDTTPTMILTQTGTNPTTYEFTYSCSTFNITTNVSWFAVGFETGIPMNYVSMIQNLKFTGPSDTQDILNNQTQNTQDIINNQNNNTQDIINNQNQNKNEVINNNNANTDKITGAITGPGLSEESKKPIDKDGINDYTDKEEAMINKNELDKINDIDIVIDTNSNTFIWDLITRILNTNTLVFGMVITILSIGLIKLLLNR